MPYKRIEDLPESVRAHLPVHAQEIYMKAFNSAFEEYADPGKGGEMLPGKRLPIASPGQR